MHATQAQKTSQSFFRVCFWSEGCERQIAKIKGVMSCFVFYMKHLVLSLGGCVLLSVSYCSQDICEVKQRRATTMCVGGNGRTAVSVNCFPLYPKSSKKKGK